MKKNKTGKILDNSGSKGIAKYSSDEISLPSLLESYRRHGNKARDYNRFSKNTQPPAALPSTILQAQSRLDDVIGELMELRFASEQHHLARQAAIQIVESLKPLLQSFDKALVAEIDLSEDLKILRGRIKKLLPGTEVSRFYFSAYRHY